MNHRFVAVSFQPAIALNPALPLPQMLVRLDYECRVQPPEFQF